MTAQDRLKILKADLLITENDQDDLLSRLLEEAAELVAIEGIKLGDSAADEGLRRMYAAYLYQQRQTPEMAMSRMLRYALNNRLMHEKGKTEEDAE